MSGLAGLGASGLPSGKKVLVSKLVDCLSVSLEREESVALTFFAAVAGRDVPEAWQPVEVDARVDRRNAGSVFETTGKSDAWTSSG